MFLLKKMEEFSLTVAEGIENYRKYILPFAVCLLFVAV